MTALTRGKGPSDNAVLATLATACLIRAGGKAMFTSEEWQAAIEHEATIWVAKEDDTVSIVLINKEGARA